MYRSVWFNQTEKTLMGFPVSSAHLLNDNKFDELIFQIENR